MPSSHPLLKWPRSDGDVSRWPTNLTVGDPKGWFEPTSLEHQKTDLYRKGIGKYLANEFLQLQQNDVQRAAIDMPPGYALFTHMQPKPDGTIRQDHYLFGSVNAPSRGFRSVPEFEEHAVWLMDTSMPLNDHSQCGCKYNSKSAKAKSIKDAAGSQTRPRPSLEPERVPKRARESDKVDYDTIATERSLDIRTKRRFRRGELVFFKIKGINPPEKIRTEAGNPLPVITHWPALISSITTKSEVLDDGSASAAQAWKMTGGEAPKELKGPKTVLFFHHQLRPLGMFSNQNEIPDVPTKDLLPWAAGLELYGGQDGWDALGMESDRILRIGIQDEAENDVPSEEDLQGVRLTERWKRRWGERIPFVDMPRNWEAAVLRLGVALRTAKTIANSWSQTDRIEVLPDGSMLRAEDVDAMRDRKKLFYQGLWLQGERIWQDDVVVLYKHPDDLPVSEDMLAASATAGERALVLKIRTICMEDIAIHDDNADLGNQPDMQNYRCLLYGNVYELCDRPTEPAEPMDDKAAAPYYYRQLNTPATEVTVDVFDVSSRCYPDLLDKNSGYLCRPGADNIATKQRVPAGPRVLGLMGLRSGKLFPPHDAVWKGKSRGPGGVLTPDDLYKMVRDATTNAEKSAREHYAARLRELLKYPTPSPESTGKNGTTNGV